MAVEAIAGSLEFRAEFEKIVDFSIEDNPVAGSFILHGLVATRREIDDGKAGVRKADLTIGGVCKEDSARIVGPAVRKGTKGILDNLARDCPIANGDAEDPTHALELPI
jgi:hypothetical protein